MIKRAIEVPDNIAQWEDVVMEYFDKHYPYLSEGISNVSFSKKEEPSKDGIGAAQYKRGGLEITIPIIIDDGELKEPNLGIYKEQIIPISEDMFNWIASNTQQIGDLIQRDSQHISNVDYLQQTGLFEEPEGGGYVKTSCSRETITRVRNQAMLYPETQWLAEKLDKVAKFAPDTYLIGKDMDKAHISQPGAYFGLIGEYATAGVNGMPKVASEIASPGRDKELEALPKSASPYRRVRFTHKYAHIYPTLKTAQEGGEGPGENELVRIIDADTYGSYAGVMGSDHGTVGSYEGRVTFDIKPLIEKDKKPLALLIVEGEGSPADPQPDINRNDGGCIPRDGSARHMHQLKAVVGDIYGVKKGYHFKKDDPSESLWPPFEQSYNMGDNIMIRLGKNSYSAPYFVDTKSSGIMGPKMESVVTMCLVSPRDYSRMDAIVADVPEVKTIRKSSIKDKQLLSMMRTEGPTVLLIPSGAIVRAFSEIIQAADKGKMISDIINGMPGSNMSLVVKVSGNGQGSSYEIIMDDGQPHQYNTASEKVANALASHFVGEDTTAVKLAAEGKIPIEIRPAYTKMRKVAQIVSDNTGAFIGAAAKINRSISRHFAKVANVSSVVDGLIGVSFVDEAKETNTEKISEQVMSLINSLGNLILMARLGKTSIPETDVTRAFWALADLLNVLRG